MYTGKIKLLIQVQGNIGRGCESEPKLLQECCLSLEIEETFVAHLRGRRGRESKSSLKYHVFLLFEM